MINLEAGLEKLVSRRDALKAAMQSAFDAYKATGEGVSGEGFRTFLAGSPGHVEAVNVVNGVRDLFDRVENTVLAVNEVAVVKRRVAGYILPDGMTLAQMVETLSAPIPTSAVEGEGDTAEP